MPEPRHQKRTEKRPDAVAGLARLLVLLTDRDDPATRGAVLCRARRHDEAVKLLDRRSEPAALLYRALAEHGRGKPDAARAALTQAEQWLKAPDPEDPELTNADRLTWQERLEADLLSREIRTLLPPGK